jgi:hypothetical protein
LNSLLRSSHLRLWYAPVLLLGTAAVLTVFGGTEVSLAASSAQPPVGLGTAQSFAVLAGSTVTNTGASIVSGDLGLFPGSAVTGFPPGKVIAGTEHITDSVAKQAKADLTTAYNDAAGRIPATVEKGELGGKTLAPGVYKATSGLSLTGTVTLKGNADAVFIFQAGSTLITASNSTVSLIGGVQACHVYWQVGSSATLGTGTTFAGTILALASAAVETGVSVDGQVLARTGQVSLDDSTITRPTCSTTGSTTTTSSASTTTSTTVVVPSAHTGEPWAGWPYWALTGLTGLLGLVCLERAVRIRRQ